MEAALLIIGLVLVVSAAKGTHKELGAQITKDLTGNKGFIVWIVAIVGIGAIGAIDDRWKPFSHAMLALIIISMVLHNKGFFANLQNAISSGPASTSAGSGPILGNVGSSLSRAVGSFLSNPGGLFQ